MSAFTRTNVAEMQECASGGSIVVVKITEFQSDAILISSNTLTLSELLAFDAKAWLSKNWITKRKSERRGNNDEFLEYLSWLWRVCVKHVLDKISTTQYQHGQSLPLVSSMPFTTQGSAENAYSRVISSYTPSIKALAYARNQGKSTGEAQAAHDLMLIMTMPTSPKGPAVRKAPRDLLGVIEEKNYIGTAVSLTPALIRLSKP